MGAGTSCAAIRLHICVLHSTALANCRIGSKRKKTRNILSLSVSTVEGRNEYLVIRFENKVLVTLSRTGNDGRMMDKARKSASSDFAC